MTKDCTECKKLYEDHVKEGYDIHPPCNTCFPGIHSYNEDVLRVYSVCSDQVIVGAMGAVGIRFDAINNAIRLLDIVPDDELYLHSAIRLLFTQWHKIAKQNAS